MTNVTDRDQEQGGQHEQQALQEIASHRQRPRLRRAQASRAPHARPGGGPARQRRQVELLGSMAPREVIRRHRAHLGRLDAAPFDGVRAAEA